MRTRHENEKQHDNASIRVVSTLSYHITNSNALPSPSLAPLTVTGDSRGVYCLGSQTDKTVTSSGSLHTLHSHTATSISPPHHLLSTSLLPPYPSIPLAPHALSDAVINVLVIGPILDDRLKEKFLKP